jgi:hypothetical protein
LLEKESRLSRKPSHKIIDACVLFDACITQPERCRANCVENKHINCKHRFRHKIYLVSCNGYIGFVRFSDLQVVLHLIYFITRNKIHRILSKNCRFIIVTRDKKFFESVRAEWDRKKKPRTEPQLEFDQDHKEIKVTTSIPTSKKGENITMEAIIEIVTINGGDHGQKAEEELPIAIKTINEMLDS